jgi:hypothetical protein
MPPRARILLILRLSINSKKSGWRNWLFDSLRGVPGRRTKVLRMKSLGFPNSTRLGRTTADLRIWREATRSSDAVHAAKAPRMDRVVPPRFPARKFKEPSDHGIDHHPQARRADRRRTAACRRCSLIPRHCISNPQCIAQGRTARDRRRALPQARGTPARPSRDPAPFSIAMTNGALRDSRSAIWNR